MPLAQQEIDTILKAGMAGPSAANARPWHLLAITDKAIIEKLAETNLYSRILQSAMFIVIVIADMDLVIPKHPLYWAIDGSIACQNMILAAEELGIGSCWIGQWPQEKKMNVTKDFFQLPQGKLVHSIVTFGYPTSKKEPNDFNEPEKIHWNQW